MGKVYLEEWSIKWWPQKSRRPINGCKWPCVAVSVYRPPHKTRSSRDWLHRSRHLRLKQTRGNIGSGVPSMKPTPAGSSQGLSRVEGCIVTIVSKGGVDVHQDLARDGDLACSSCHSIKLLASTVAAGCLRHTPTTDETVRCMSFSKRAPSTFLKSYRLRSRFIDSLIHP